MKVRSTGVLRTSLDTLVDGISHRLDKHSGSIADRYEIPSFVTAGAPMRYLEHDAAEQIHSPVNGIDRTRLDDRRSDPNDRRSCCSYRREFPGAQCGLTDRSCYSGASGSFRDTKESGSPKGFSHLLGLGSDWSIKPSL